METIVITTQDNNTYKFIPAQKTTSGDFSPCDFKDSIFAEGSTCKVFLALGEDRRRYLIKQYKLGFNGDESYERISNIMRRYNKQGDNYILGDVYTGIGCFENSKEKELLNYKVFKYREGSVLLPHEGRESIFTNIKVVYSTLLDFLSFLNTLKLLHAEMDGEAYIHCDIKLDNTFALKINSNSVVQLIDMDSVRSKKELVKAVENGVPYNQLIPTTAKYYSNDDVKALCKLNGKDLQRCVNILDTTAAVKMLSEMLVGNIDYDTSKDDAVLDKNEALQTALYHFFEKGLWNDFSERFCNVDEMLQQLSAIVATISDSLPTTIIIEKLKAISQSSIINQLKNSYIKRHGLNNTATREDIFISSLLSDIDTNILPPIRHIGIDDLDSYYILNQNETPLYQLIQRVSGQAVLLIGQAGSAKSTMCYLECLKNLVDLYSDKLYLYVPLKEYEGNVLSTIEKTARIRISDILPSKVVCFFDGFDEIPERRMCKGNTSIFDEKFFSEIQNLSDKGYTCVVTSRTPPVLKKNRVNWAIVQDIPPSQQVAFIYNKTGVQLNISKSMEHLLKNAFILTIYADLLKSENSLSDIENSCQILERYFISIIKNKKNCTYDSAKKEWNHILQEVSILAYQQNRQLYGEDEDDRDFSFEKMEHSWYFVAKITDEYGFEGIVCLDYDDKTLIFSHEIFREFFVGFQATQHFLNILSKKSFTPGFNALSGKRFFIKYMPYLSHQTLMFISDNLKLGCKDPHWIETKSGNEIAEDLLEEMLYREKYPITLGRVVRIPWGYMSDHVYWYLEKFARNSMGTASTQQFIFVLTQLAYNKQNTFENYDFNYHKAIPYVSGFSGCELIREITLHNGARIVGKRAFNNCTNLQNVVLSESVRVVDSHAFDGCVSLKEINIPGHCKKLQRNGAIVRGNRFAYPASFKPSKIELNKNIKNIQSGFVNTQNLQEIIVHNQRYQVINKCLIDTRTQTLILAYGDFQVPDTIVRIGQYAFSGNTQITQIIIPKNVKKIHASAFYGCVNLKEIKTYSKNISKMKFMI